MVKHVKTGRQRKFLKRERTRWFLDGIGWAGLNPETGVPAGYPLVVRS